MHHGVAAAKGKYLRLEVGKRRRGKKLKSRPHEGTVGFKLSIWEAKYTTEKGIWFFVAVAKPFCSGSFFQSGKRNFRVKGLRGCCQMCQFCLQL